MIIQLTKLQLGEETEKNIAIWRNPKKGANRVYFMILHLHSVLFFFSVSFIKNISYFLFFIAEHFPSSLGF